MRISFRAGAAAVALTGGSVIGLAAPAHADGTVLYVRQLYASCSDSGPGTLAQPFCTIAAAAAVVTAGQTVDAAGSLYRERVTVTSSGTPDQPITFRGAGDTVVHLSAPNAGFVVDGQHDIVFRSIAVSIGAGTPAFDIRDSSAITLERTAVTATANATAPAIRLHGVTASSLKGFAVNGPSLPAGVALEGGTSGVTLSGLTVTSPSPVEGAVGIRVGGAGNRIVGNIVDGFGGAAVSVEPDATDTHVVNNVIRGGGGYGVHNRGAAGTAVTNNTIRERCRDGVRVDGASTGVSVQNNALAYNGWLTTGACPSGQAGGPEIAVYDGALADTVVDYNNTAHSPANGAYAWGGAPTDLAGFRAASGQGQHDRNTSLPHDVVDSANSAAPGYPATDRTGAARVDDPGVANTGAGPVPYADRGATETTRRPFANSTLALDAGASTVTVDASASTPGTNPIASYTFSWGDGTSVSQASPYASHRYTAYGHFTVHVTVTATDGQNSTMAREVSVLRPTGTWALLNLFYLRYATVRPGNIDIVPEDAGVTEAGLFDVVDAGSGTVALFSRATRRYVTNNIPDRLYMTTLTAGDGERFTVVRNADGSISLRAVTSGLYVSLLTQSSPFLAAKATAIGTWEKFHQVKAADAGHTLNSHANGRFVSAEGAGAKPLIASRPAASTWETFDIVDLGNGQVALFARANNHFVAAESAGTQPLKAGRVAVGTWERFTLIRNADGSVSLRAAINDRYVAAEGAGTKPLLAQRTAISTWEKFTLG